MPQEPRSGHLRMGGAGSAELLVAQPASGSTSTSRALPSDFPYSSMQALLHLVEISAYHERGNKYISNSQRFVGRIWGNPKWAASVRHLM